MHAGMQYEHIPIYNGSQKTSVQVRWPSEFSKGDSSQQWSSSHTLLARLYGSYCPGHTLSQAVYGRWEEAARSKARALVDNRLEGGRVSALAGQVEAGDFPNSATLPPLISN